MVSNWSASSASSGRKTCASVRGRSCSAGYQSGRLPKDQLLYERRNGHFVLQVTGHPDFGVPFGQDRLVPIFLATLAVRQKSQLIRFRTAAEMLESFGMHTGGKEYRRLVAAFERIFGATIFFGTDTLGGKVKVIQRARFNFLREAQIWYSRTPDQRILSAEFENVIMLSDDLYQEIVAHPVPNDLEAVKLLAASPACARPLHVAFLSMLQGEGRRGSPSSGSSVWRTRLARWSTRDRGGSGRCSSSG